MEIVNDFISDNDFMWWVLQSDNQIVDENMYWTISLNVSVVGAGRTVFAVNAVDYDAGENARVEYNIVSVDSIGGVPLFGIDRTSGQIYVSIMDDSVLDRETQDTYSLVVQAKDKGTPTPLSSNQTITIRLSDINDQSPVFSQTIYRVTMSENLPKGASIISVTASDQDIGINAQLIYSLETTQDKGYFYIDTRNETNEGILRVFESNVSFLFYYGFWIFNRARLG